MTIECIPENQGNSPAEQRSIVVHSEQTSMEQVVKNPFLEIVGFSPKLPQRLSRLNDVLLRRDVPHINTVGILMVPGEIPLITTKISHVSGMRIYVEGGADGLASLEMKSSSASAAVTIEDIQGFVKKLFPNKEVRVFSRAYQDLEEPIDDLDRDLYAVSSEILKPLNELRLKKGKFGSMLPYYTFEVGVSGQDLPPHATCLFTFILKTYNQRVGCNILEFNYKGNVSKVEEVIDRVTELLDKPIYYPFTDRAE